MLSRRSLIAAAAAVSTLAGAEAARAETPGPGESGPTGDGTGTAPGGTTDTGGPTTPAAPPMPAIRPRSDWATDNPVRGELVDEEDVRFLLVHHTQSPNGYAADKVPGQLRGFHRYHTGPDKKWADVAYNFFVDAQGTIWEGRQGSIERPVKGDATGGSQGHALLCCFVGDFTAEPPTEEAMTAMVALLAWLAHRQGLDLAGPVTFVSEGSNRWRKGVEVTTEQVAGHRDMSLTECPGDALYPLVAGRLLPEARLLLHPPAPSPEPTPSAAPPETAAAGSPDGPGPIAPAPERDWTLVRGVAGGVLAASVGALLVTARGGRPRSEQLGEQDDAADDQGEEQPDQEAPEGR